MMTIEQKIEQWLSTKARYEYEEMRSIHISDLHGLCKLARERLQAGTFQQGIEAATTVIDAYDEYDSNLCCDGRECGCRGESVHGVMKHLIRNLKPEVGNG